MKIPPYHRAYDREKVHATHLDLHLLNAFLVTCIPIKDLSFLSVILLVIAKSIEIAVPVFVVALHRKSWSRPKT